MSGGFLAWVSGFLLGLALCSGFYAHKCRKDNVELDGFLKRLRELDVQYVEMAQQLYKRDRENEALRDYVKQLQAVDHAKG